MSQRSSNWRPLGPSQTAQVYRAFLQTPPVLDLISVLPHPQIYLDHVVGHYLPSGEDDLNDPTMFGRVMWFREALEAALKADYSKMPKIVAAETADHSTDYDPLSNTIRLSRSDAATLSRAAKQMSGFVGTILTAWSDS